METLDTLPFFKNKAKHTLLRKTSTKPKTSTKSEGFITSEDEDFTALSYEAHAKKALLGASLKNTVMAVIFGLLGLALGFASLLYTLLNSNSTSYLPYIITIDKNGALLGHDTITETSIPEPARAAFVCDFIEALYTISSDRDYQVRLIRTVYARLSKDALLRSMVDSHYEQSEKLFLTKNHHREVIIESLLKKSEKTYEVEYTIKNRSEKTMSTEQFKATVVLSDCTREKRSLEDLRLNPLGLLISHLDIHKKLVGRSVN